MATSHFLLRTTLIAVVAMMGCFVMSIGTARAQWDQVAQFSNGNVGQGCVIYFLDSKTGFLGFGNDNNSNTYSPIWKSSDSGVTWTLAASPTVGPNEYVNDIWFSAPNNGWAAIGSENYGRLWHTTDTGNTWIELNNFDSRDPSSVRSTSKNLCIAGDDFGVMISTDTGETFTQVFNESMRGLDYVDGLHIVCTPYTSLDYYFSADGGSTWLPSALHSGDSWGIFGVKGTPDFYIAPENSSSRNPSIVYLSTDYGVTWSAISSLPFKTTGEIKGTGCAMFLQSSGNIQGQPPGLFRSMDNGITWKNIYGPNNFFDTRFAFTNGGGTIFAFDQNGILWKTSDQGDGFASSGPPSLAIVPDAVDLGSTNNCQSIDTAITITYTNNSCAIDTLNSLSMSPGTGFIISGVLQPPPVILFPGESDSLHISYLSGVGHLYDTVVITGEPNNDSVWRIPVQVNIIPADSVEFSVAVSPDPIKPGDTLTVTVTPDLTVQNVGLKNISGTIEYRYDSYDLITKLGGTVAAPIQFEPLSEEHGTAYLPFTISSFSTIALDSGTPILTLRLQAMLSDSTVSSFNLDSLLLNGSDPTYENCVLSASSGSAVSHIALACGDTLLMLAMQNELVFAVGNPKPNPVTAEDGGQSSLPLLASTDGTAEVRVTDMLGRMVVSNSIPLTAGEPTSYALDLSNQPAGAYFYTFVFSSLSGTVSKSGTVMVLR
jgi:hypothetical protein